MYIPGRKSIWYNKSICTGYMGSVVTHYHTVYPTVERGPQKQPKIKKLSKEEAADKATQTKDKEKPL